MTQKEQTQAMLAAVNSAITELLGGAESASISTGGFAQSYTRVDLDKLRTMRRDLRLELQSYRNKGRPAITIMGVRHV